MVPQVPVQHQGGAAAFLGDFLTLLCSLCDDASLIDAICVDCRTMILAVKHRHVGSWL